MYHRRAWAREDDDARGAISERDRPSLARRAACNSGYAAALRLRPRELRPGAHVRRSHCEYFEVQAGARIDPFYLLNCFDQQRFLFLFSGDEDVGDAVLQQARIRSAPSATPRRSPDLHQYIIILDQSAIKVGDVPEASTCLIIQPMSVERVTTYLRDLSC